ncbi:MAG: hypothetical protein IKR08_04225 [Firmicutes bacterium]|nr:hypothetical protein [Bacillota bacterium]
MTVIDENTILLDQIYVSKPDTTEEPVFAYVRFFKDGEIGFSVLDEAFSDPDFSNCGVFWVRPEDFPIVFMPYVDSSAHYKRYSELGRLRSRKASYN